MVRECRNGRKVLVEQKGWKAACFIGTYFKKVSKMSNVVKNRLNVVKVG